MGVVSLERDGAAVTGRSTQRKRFALLALLAAARNRAVSRDKALAYLWPERDTERARHTLSQTLYALRQELGDDAIIAGVDELRLNSACVSSDVAEFQSALEEGDAERALALYRGPFLDGFFVADVPEFEQWAEGERQRLALLYASALDRMADTAHERGDHAQAVEHLRRRAGLDALNSKVALKLMDALAAMGDHAGALRHAKVHATLLRGELDVPPDPAVTALAERLRGELTRFTPPARVTSFEPEPEPEPESEPDPEPEFESEPVVRREGRRTSVIARASIAAVLLALAMWSLVHRNGTASTAIPRAIVLGAIQGPDASLALAVEEVLRAELAAAPELRLLGELPVRETLRLMSLPGATTLTETVVREIAQRRGVSLAVVGAVVPVGAGTTIRIVIVDAAAGTEVATLKVQVGGADAIIPAVARLAHALRKRVSQSTVVAGPGPLPAVTTTSLPALQNYALARQALSRVDRQTAIALLEGALEHDSLFALGHLLVGDLLWYVDQQKHAEAHLTTAHTLSGLLPPRERLIVRARYEQLVRDRLDSALTYWEQLRASYPDEVQAYQGLIWTYAALSEPGKLVEVTDQLLRLDSSSLNAQLHLRMAGLLATGDTAGAFVFARLVRDRWPASEFDTRKWLASARGDWLAVKRMQDSVITTITDSVARANAAVGQHIALLALGRLDEATDEMTRVVRGGQKQFPPRALLLQAQTEAWHQVRTAQARARGRAALQWVAAADLSAPTVARLVERSVSVAAYTGDRQAIEAARRLVRERDAGRGLPSYRTALLTIDASAAFARGEMKLAARLAEQSFPVMFFGRSNGTVALLAADARAAAGDRAGADSLYRRMTIPGGLRDNDGETLWVLRTIAARRLASP